jgi:hypothetical protein
MDALVNVRTSLPRPSRLVAQKEDSLAFQKARTLRMVLAIAFLGMLVALIPGTCRAQAEIDPDHYEISSGDTPTANIPKTATPRATVGGDSFRGRFVLPCDIRYAGVALERGSYSISIHSLGKQNLVTFIPDGSGVKVQIRARVSPESNAQGPSSLVLEHAGRQFRLIRIRLHELRMTLDLEAGQRNNASSDTKLIPISYTTGENSED